MSDLKMKANNKGKKKHHGVVDKHFLEQQFRKFDTITFVVQKF